MKNKAFLVLSKLCNFIAYGWMILLFIDKLILLIMELGKEPSIWHGIKRFWSILNPFDLAFNMQFWIFLLLLLPASGLIKLSEYFKNKADNE